MKYTTLISIVILTVFIYSCSKDETAPAITMLGKNPDTLIVKTVSSYNDAGATANDNEDGDVTANIVVSTNVNTQASGHYLIYYTVEDKAGNVSERLTRIVEVIKADGTYDATFNCFTADTIGVTSNYTNDTLALVNLYSSSNFIKAALNVTIFTIYSQELIVGTNITGTINASGTTLTVNFSTSGGVVISNCVATLKKR